MIGERTVCFARGNELRLFSQRKQRLREGIIVLYRYVKRISIREEEKYLTKEQY